MDSRTGLVAVGVRAAASGGGRGQLWVTDTRGNAARGFRRIAYDDVRDRLWITRTGRLFITGTKDGLLQLVDP